MQGFTNAEMKDMHLVYGAVDCNGRAAYILKNIRTHVHWITKHLENCTVTCEYGTVSSLQQETWYKADTNGKYTCVRRGDIESNRRKSWCKHTSLCVILQYLYLLHDTQYQGAFTSLSFATSPVNAIWGLSSMCKICMLVLEPMQIWHFQVPFRLWMKHVSLLKGYLINKILMHSRAGLFINISPNIDIF